MSKLFRIATSDDLDSIYQIIKDAKEQLKVAGSTQWQSGEPSLNTIQKDIENNSCYIIENDGIIATLNISFTEDLPYRIVFDGAWSNDDAYVTLHRIAIAQRAQGKGVMNYLLDCSVALALSKDIHQIRIDTYYKNEKMIHSLQNYGFKRVGIIHVSDPVDRVREAFEYLF